MIAGLACCAAAAAAGPSAAEAHEFARMLAAAGQRPAASAAERRAQAQVTERFAAAGLRIGTDRFRVPGKGRSANVVGIRAGREHCLHVLMAHSDTVPPSAGANDNASGLGALVALAGALGRAPAPPCDTWLVATGAEERIYTGRPDHLGALAVVRRLKRFDRTGDLRFGLSLDEVGRDRRFLLRSPARAPRAGVEEALLRAARAAGVDVRWRRDDGTGNSDHRELALAGLPAMKLGVYEDGCRHTACDRPDRLQRGAFTRALRVVWRLIR